MTLGPRYFWLVCSVPCPETRRRALNSLSPHPNASLHDGNGMLGFTFHIPWARLPLKLSTMSVVSVAFVPKRTVVFFCFGIYNLGSVHTLFLVRSTGHVPSQDLFSKMSGPIRGRQTQLPAKKEKRVLTFSTVRRKKVPTWPMPPSVPPRPRK